MNRGIDILKQGLSQTVCKYVDQSVLKPLTMQRTSDIDSPSILLRTPVYSDGTQNSRSAITKYVLKNKLLSAY